MLQSCVVLFCHDDAMFVAIQAHVQASRVPDFRYARSVIWDRLKG